MLAIANKRQRDLSLLELFHICCVEVLKHLFFFIELRLLRWAVSSQSVIFNVCQVSNFLSITNILKTKRRQSLICLLINGYGGFGLIRKYW